MNRPLDKRFVVAYTLDDTRRLDLTVCSAIPVLGHPGAFGVERKHHIHEGVDLYCNPHDSVFSMLSGTVVSIEPFTGPKAGMPWWNDTQGIAVLCARDGFEFTLIYGEISVDPQLRVGDAVMEGQRLGYAIPVLKTDKGLPMTMLHIEQYWSDVTTSCGIWHNCTPRPYGLQDPTQTIALACGATKRHIPDDYYYTVDLSTVS